MAVLIPLIVLFLFFAQYRVFIILLSLLLLAFYLLFQMRNIQKALEKEKRSRVVSFLLHQAEKSLVLRRVIIILCVLSIGLAVAVGVYVIPQAVEVELQGIEIVFLNTEEFEIRQTVQIQVSGHLQRGIFVNPRFSGYIEIDVYPSTMARELSVYFSGLFDGSRPLSFGQLRYERIVDGHIRLDLYADLHVADRSFSSFAIVLQHASYYDIVEEGLHLIIAPAVDLESAEKVMANIGLLRDGGLVSR